MRRAKIILTVFALFCITAFGISSFQNANDVIKKVTTALQNGNLQDLSKFFNKTVELEILGDENFYSISQAELLLKDFFEKNKPSKFVVNHQGTKDATSYAIGTLTTTKGNLRVSFFMKTEQNQTLIHQFRIEQNDEGKEE